MKNARKIVSLIGVSLLVLSNSIFAVPNHNAKMAQNFHFHAEPGGRGITGVGIDDFGDFMIDRMVIRGLDFDLTLSTTDERTASQFKFGLSAAPRCYGKITIPVRVVNKELVTPTTTYKIEFPGCPGITPMQLVVTGSPAKGYELNAR